jgi:hypothetical protein
MQAQRNPNWLPISVFALAAAIVFTGLIIALSISSAAQSAELQRSAATDNAAFQASLDARNAQSQAAHQATMQQLLNPPPSLSDQINQQVLPH